uniref:Uncharacterized protein n=1 Tax=Anguilla anguilla TaxID=7936 RepID=A0A0E9TPL9_ANGAN
MLCKKLCK